jgi:hypothetical protein
MDDKINRLNELCRLETLILTRSNHASCYRSFVLNILYLFSYHIPFFIIMHFLFISPISYFTHICYIIVTYFVDNILFIIGHLSLHASFIETDTVNLQHLPTFTLIAYLHHYHNPLIFSAMKFREYMLAYIGSFSYVHNNFVSIFNYFFAFIILSFYFSVNINIILVVILYATYYLGLYKWLVNCLIYLFCKDIIGENNALLYVCYSFLMLYVQGLVHLWYHTKVSQRQTHFGKILFIMMTLMEKINLISTETHKIHHSHNYKNIQDSELWNDLWVPNIFNTYAEQMWNEMVNVYVSGKRNMETYIGNYFGYRAFILIILPPILIGVCGNVLSYFIGY